MTKDTLEVPFNSDSVGGAVAALDDFLAEVGELPVPKSLMRSGVLELVRNVLEWGDNDGCLTAVADGGEVVVGVEDYGPGIHHHLDSEYGCHSPVAAAEYAFREGTTSSRDFTRGRGLHFCLGLTTRAGSIIMETVGASVSGWAGELHGASTARGRTVGTLVTLRFPIITL